MQMNEMRVSPRPCPWCGTVHDGLVGMSSAATPNPGDVSLCIECGEWSVFAADLSRRKPTEDEFTSIGTSAACQRAREVWLRLKEAPDEDDEDDGTVGGIFGKKITEATQAIIGSLQKNTTPSEALRAMALATSYLIETTVVTPDKCERAMELFFEMVRTTVRAPKREDGGSDE